MTTRRFYRLPCEFVPDDEVWCAKYLYDVPGWGCLVDNRTADGTWDIWFEDYKQTHEWLLSHSDVMEIDKPLA